jgi:hypothetical protein
LRRQLLPRLALLLGLFCAYSQISGALHWVLVQHARCAEHGEWIHAEHGEGGHAVAGDHGHAEPAAPSQSSEARPADDEAHGHDHCTFLVTPPELTPEAGTLASLAPAPTGGAAGFCRASDRGAPSALYLLAPTTSPPTTLA